MIAIFDCFSGVAGDMALGALVGAIGDGEWLKAMVDRLGPGACELEIDQVRRGALASIKVSVRVPADDVVRGLSDLRALLERCELPPRASAWADRVVSVLVRAEASVHGTDPLTTHLHEAGGIDAIVDIAGTCLGLDLLGVQELFSGPLPLGGGMVRCAHGRLPVPAPAVVELLRGVPVLPGASDDGELVTPTGAALLVGLGTRFVTPPGVLIDKVGYGAGSRLNGPNSLPNVLRLVVGRASSFYGNGGDTVVVVDSVIDDMTPELLDSAVSTLVGAGALEVLRTPVVTSKGRSAWELTVIAPQQCRDAVLRGLFSATSTIGARERLSSRVILDREEASVTTPYGDIRVKLSQFEGRIVNVKPEHGDCVELARKHAVDAKRVAAAAVAAAAGLYGSTSDVPRGTSDMSSGASS